MINFEARMVRLGSRVDIDQFGSVRLTLRTNLVRTCSVKPRSVLAVRFRSGTILGLRFSNT
eukprot:2529985-Pyramimonas_sp.AAC.1